MKKLSFIIIALCLAFICHSQAIGTSEGSYYLNRTNAANYYQDVIKTLSYDDEYKLTLTTAPAGNAVAHYFVLIHNGELLTKTLRIPKGYSVKDFAILEDTVIFVGNYGDTSFLAYFNINNMKNMTSNQSNINVTYTIIDQDTAHPSNIKRVIAYKNDNDERIILALGSIFYGNPPVAMAVAEGLEGPITYKWIESPVRYRNVLIKYNIEEQQMSLIQEGNVDEFVLGSGLGNVNKVSYYFPSSLPDSLINNNEVFHDIAVTDSYIWLVSSAKDSSGIFTSTTNQRDRLILRTFDKNTLQPVLSKYIGVTDSFYFFQDYEDGKVLIRPLMFDNVAVGYLYGYQDIKHTKTNRYIIDFITIQDSDYVITDSRREKNPHDDLPLLCDMEFDQQNSELWVLIHFGSASNIHLFNTENSYDSVYYAYGWDLEYTNNKDDKAIHRSLLYDDKGFMIISGVYNQYYLNIIDKDLYAMHVITKYFAPIAVEIHKHIDEAKVWSERDNLSLCKFGKIQAVNYNPTTFKYTRTINKTFIATKTDRFISR